MSPCNGLQIGPLARWIGERALITMGAASLGAGVLLMPLSTHLSILYAAAFLMILGNIRLHSIAQQPVGAIRRSRQPRGVLGLGQAFAGSGRIIGPALAGVIFASIGINWPFFFSARLR